MSGGGGGKNGGTSVPVIGGLQVSVSTYGNAIPIVWGQNRIPSNLLWYGNFHAVAQSSGGGKGGGGSTPSSYTYYAAGLAGLCEGAINGIAQVWQSKNSTTLAALGISWNSGTYPQTPWGYLTTNFPTQAIGYSGIASIYSSNFTLSSSAQMPNILYEVQGLKQYGFLNQPTKTFSVSGATFTCTGHGYTLNQVVRFYGAPNPSPLLAATDYYIVNPTANTFQLTATPYQPSAASGNPIIITTTTGGTSNIVQNWIQGANSADILTDFLTNPVFGVSTTFPLGAITQFSNYCVANGFFLSPALVAQSQASVFIGKLCEICNTAPVWSEGVLKLIPYGDTAATGNGITFTPITTPQYDLNDDDFLDDSSGDPITITRSNSADAFNQVQVQFADRTNQYNGNVVQAQDQSNIDLFGLRPAPPFQHDFITDMSVARNVAQILLQRLLYLRNQYKFKLSWKYARLEPMDLVTVTDVALGLNMHVVRVTEVEEDSDEQITVIAEDYLANNATATAYPAQTHGGAVTLFNTDPGATNAPLVFEPPTSLSGVPQLWMAASGGTNWGGCDVWVSRDNTTYSLAGTITGGARQGTGVLALGTDPDTINTAAIDTTISGGVLSGGTLLDRDQMNTLCYLGGELISYQNCVLTSASHYNLTSLRRGAYGSPITAHTAGAPFARLDGSIFKYNYDPSLVGSTLYFKLLSFNQYGQNKYSLASVTATSYVVGGSYLGMISGLALVSPFVGKSVSVKWNAFQGATGYRAEVWHAGVLKRTVNSIGSTTYTYSYEDNIADGGIWRSVDIKIYATSATSTTLSGATLTVTNPQVATPAGASVIAGSLSVQVSATRPADTDYAGMMIFGSTVSTFTPDVSTYSNMLYDGTENSHVFTGLVGGTPWYYVIAFYDQFGKDFLNLSSQLSATPMSAGGVPIVSSLAATGANGDVVSLTTDHKLYRYNTTLTNGTMGAAATGVANGTVNVTFTAGGVTPAVGQLVTGAGVPASTVIVSFTSTTAVLSKVVTTGSALTFTLTAWQSWIDGSDILAASITGGKIAAGTVTATNIDGSNLNIVNGTFSGSVTVGTGSSVPWNYLATLPANISAAGAAPTVSLLNNAITLSSSGVLSGGGGGAVTIGGLGYTGALNATANQTDAVTNAAISTAATTATWTGVGTKPANLAALTGTEGIQNSAISLSTAGVLSGAGGGSLAYSSIPGIPTLGTLAALSAITSTQITPGGIVAASIAANTITASQIASGTITASQIASGTITAAQIAAGTITAASGLIANLAVNTLQIANQAVTIPSSVFTAANLAGVAAGTVFQTLTITSTGAPLAIFAGASFLNSAPYTSSASTCTPTFYLKRGATVLQTYVGNAFSGASGGVSSQPYLLMWPPYSETLAAGSYTYTLEASFVLSGTGGVSATNRSIFIVETKR